MKVCPMNVSWCRSIGHQDMSVNCPQPRSVGSTPPIQLPLNCRLYVYLFIDNLNKFRERNNQFVVYVTYVFMYMLLEKHLFKVNINCLKRYLNSTRNFRGRLLQLLIDLPATNISTQCLPLLRKSVPSSPRPSATSVISRTGAGYFRTKWTQLRNP